MNKTLHALLFAFIALGSTALFAQTSALSVEKIMQDPKWMGTFPERINWGPQSKTITYDRIPEKFKIWVVGFGRIGYFSRGFTVGIAALLLMDTAYTDQDITNANKEAAFSFMQYAFGNFILGAIAVGFIIYSVYVFVEVRYRRIDMA